MTEDLVLTLKRTIKSTIEAGRGKNPVQSQLKGWTLTWSLTLNLPRTGGSSLVLQCPTMTRIQILTLFDPHTFSTETLGWSTRVQVLNMIGGKRYLERVTAKTVCL